MKYTEVNNQLLKEFPRFIPDDISENLPYLFAGDFTRFMLDAFYNGDLETYHQGLQFIEKLHLSDVQMTRELATIGYLESFQNTWPTELIESNIPYKNLGDESKKWWDELNRFWSGEVRLVGETFNQSTRYIIAIEQLIRVKELLSSQNTNIFWSSYNSVEDVMNDLDQIILELRNENSSTLEKLNFLFAPTGNFQEISISSGWGEEFIEISKIIDSIT